MSTATNLDGIFKQKQVLRSKVRKSLKSMDPSLRSQEGTIKAIFFFFSLPYRNKNHYYLIHSWLILIWVFIRRCNSKSCFGSSMV
jgi:hypothetical protein